jgi:hypothetical protein
MTGVATVATLLPILNTRMPVDVIVLQAASGNVYKGMGHVTNAGLVSLGVMNLTTYQLAVFSGTVPVTWAAGDIIFASFVADIG